MFQKLQYILFFVVFVISIFFVVSTLTFSGRLAEGSGPFAPNYDLWAKQQTPLCRLCSKQLAGPLVAPRWLAIPALLLRLWRHRLLMATLGQQQQMSTPSSMSQFPGPDDWSEYPHC